MAATFDPRVLGAPGRFRTWLKVALAASLGVGILAVGIDAAQRLSGAAMAPLVPRLLAATALALGGATAVIAVMERRARGTSRRSTPWLLVAVGIAVIFFGQVIGYVTTAGWAGPFDVRTEAVPLLVGAPLYCAGLLWLSWPPSMSRFDRWSVAADTLLAAFSLLPAWIAIVAPAAKRADSASENVLVPIDSWVQYSAVVAVVAMASASRCSGALPIRQLILLQSATVLYLIADILGDTIAAADRASGITWSIMGYLLAVVLFVGATVRPALEADSASSVRLRDWWSTVVPLIPIVVLVVAIARVRGWDGTLTRGLRTAAGLALLALVVTTVAWRVALTRQLQAARAAMVASRLQEGAGEDWFAALVGDARDVVTVVDHTGVILYQTPSVTTFGYQPGALVGHRLEDFAAPADGGTVAQMLLRAAMDEADRGPHEVIVRDGSGVPHDTETTVSPLRLLGADGFVLTTRDVTDRRVLLDQLSASHSLDSLTGLSNRDGFLAQLGQLLPAERTQTAVCLIDLHSFRNVNERHGHAVGDEVLRAVADCLTRLPASVVAVGRLAGDEFAYAVRASAPEVEVARIRLQLRDDVANLTLPTGVATGLAFAMGYTTGRDDAADPADLVEEAGMALIAARAAGADGIAVFAPEMRAAFVERLRVEQELRFALANDRMVVQYQPIVSMADGSIVGAEALVRMLDREGTMIPPFVFVPVAERIGLIHELGQYVLTVALRDIQRFSAALGRDLSVSVNVSALQLDNDLHPTVEDAMTASGIDPHLVTLELTETVLAENQLAAGQYLARLRELGCKVAMDDFGTGYSSLAYLASLPVDIIKVDRSFVMGLGQQESSLVLVRTVIQLARSLGLSTVAEGVETLDQAEILRDLGADRGQGYLFAKPLSSSDLLALLAVTAGVLPVAPQ